MSQRFRSDPVPPEFAEIMAPLIRRCRTENGQFSEDDARDYYAILKTVPLQYLAAAVAEHLKTATEPWMPMPARLLLLARDARKEHRLKAIETAPDCDTCQNTGLVCSRVRGSGKRWSSRRCSCPRGWQFTTHARFDPQSMETWREHGRRLMGPEPVQLPAVIPLPDLGVRAMGAK